MLLPVALLCIGLVTAAVGPVVAPAAFVLAPITAPVVALLAAPVAAPIYLAGNFTENKAPQDKENF